MPSNHLILCHSLLLSSIFPSIRVISKELALRIRWPKYWSFCFSISPSNEHPGLISFRMDWLDFLAVQGTLKSLLQHYSSKTSIIWCPAFLIVQLLHQEEKASLQPSSPSPEATTAGICFPPETQRLLYSDTYQGFTLCQARVVSVLCLPSQHRSRESNPVPLRLQSLPLSPTSFRGKADLAMTATMCPPALGPRI